jgi:hypothetical protein
LSEKCPQNLPLPTPHDGRSSPSPSSRTGGGSAAAAGIGFQADVAAWFCLQILAEQAVPTSFGLPATTSLERVVAETFDPVDDLRVGTSAGGAIYVQCKTSASVSPLPDSAFGKTVDQFVRQLIQGHRTATVSRALDPERDRLLLAVGPESPATLTDRLAKAIERLGTARSEPQLADVESGLNQDDAAYVRTLKGHADRVWQSTLSAAMPHDTWLSMLRLIRIVRFDFSEDGSHAREADQLLRGQILDNPTSASAAWAQVRAIAASFAPDRTGGDRSLLRSRLADAGFGLKGVKSLEKEIATVRSYSSDRLSLLKRHSSMSFGTQEVKIKRHAVDAIAQMASEGHLLVVGEPGAGKSGCVHDFVARLSEARIPFVLIEAEHVDASSQTTLARDLGINQPHTLVDVLASWPIPAKTPEAPAGYLVIDALDAARGEFSLSTLCDLVRRVQEHAPGWRVIASIREFELKHSRQVQSLFAGRPGQIPQLPALASVRHVLVQRLSSEELQEVTVQVPTLQPVLENATASLRELVRNPFNLRLLVELLAANVPTPDLAAVKAQVELLDRYWEERLSPVLNPSLERAARALVGIMKDARSLSVDQHLAIAAFQGADQQLVRLQRLGVLRSERRSALAGTPAFLSFAHHILFDYATARLWMGSLEPAILAELEDPKQQDLVLFARPSLVLTFQRLWHMGDASDPSREMFWARALTMLESRLRLSARIVASTVAAAEFRSVTDLDYLLSRIGKDKESPASKLFQYVITAVLTRADDQQQPLEIIGRDARPWLSVSREVIDRGLKQNAWQVYLLLRVVERQSDGLLQPDQQDTANHVARGLLQWSLDDPKLTATESTAVAVVSKTARSHPAESIASLTPLLDQSHSGEWHETLRPIADNFAALASLDQRFASRVMHAAYTHAYDPEDRTALGGRLMPLLFAKNDSLKHVQEKIASGIAKLGQRRPVASARLTLRLLTFVVKKERPSTGEKVVRVPFRGGQAVIARDYSSMWADREYSRSEEWYPALKGFRGLLKRIGEGAKGQPARLKILSLTSKKPRPAVIWTTLLEAGAASPEGLGSELIELLTSKDVLTGYDTESAARKLLRAVWPFADRDHRIAIETAILSIADGPEDHGAEWRRQNRDRLLLAIRGELESPAAMQRRDELLVAGQTAPEDRPRSVGKMGFIAEDEYLKNQGVDLDALQNKEVRELTNRLQEAKAEGTDQRFSAEQVHRLLPDLRMLKALLFDAAERKVHAELIERAQGAVFSSLAKLAAAADLKPESADYTTLRSMLLTASTDPDPKPPEEPEDRKRGMVGWGGGQPRIEAAGGLISLARRLKQPDTELSDALYRLSHDEHWAVRFQVRAHVNALWDFNRPLMWKIVEETVVEEPDIGVLRFFVNSLSVALLRADPERIDTILSRVQERVEDVDDHDSIGKQLAAVVVWRVVVQDHEKSRERIRAWVADPLKYDRLVETVIQRCRGLMVLDAVGEDRNGGQRARKWAFDTLRAAITTILACFSGILARHASKRFDLLTSTEQASVRRLYQLADAISNQIYFASGAFNDKGGQTDEEDSARTPEQVRRFLQEGKQCIEAVSDCPFVHTAYDILKTLQYLIPVDPVGVFPLVHRCLKASKEDFIHHESMAADVVVEIVERYFADYRPLFRDNHDLQTALLDVLDMFVEAGYPKATRLTFRLDEVFR